MRARHALFLVVAALACVATISIGSATASPRTAADQSWTDPAGDAVAGAPDMTAVGVSNDEAGTITMTVTVPLNDGSMMVFLDTNQNGSFSDPTDKITGAFGIGSGLAIGIIVKSNPLTAKVTATATTVTFVFSKADAGIAEGFGFWILSQSAAQFGSDQAGDMFPDGTGVLTYNLSKPPAPPPPPPPVTPPAAAVTPVIGTPSATPLRAIAGKPMVVTFPVTRSDTGKPLATGKMICDPSVAGKVIPHSESFKAGKARLSFVVPRTAKDKQLTVKVTIRTAGGSATKTATYRVG